MRDLTIIVGSGAGIGVSLVRFLELHIVGFYEFVDMLSKAF